MNSKQNLKIKEDFTDEIESKDSSSVDDFIKQLEEKEKDLHISSDLVIEIEEPDFDEASIDEFLQSALPNQDAGLSTNNLSGTVTHNHKTFSELEDEVLELKTQISKIEAERIEMVENSRRRHKDFENYKSRTERERHETFTNQVSNLATQMLPVLDNLNRALDFAADISDEKEKEFQQFFQGISLVNQQLNEVLAGMGVSPIASVGEHFDPHCHEAVAVEETENFPPQTVSTELLRGYRIGSRVIRPSMVKVAASVQPQSDGNPQEKIEVSDDILFETE
ncbi:MAG TPA: nucleotide exchange factor GrpE [Pyrinomonadaceae bacterium]|jgi:molecular chaperone GrpE